MHHHNVVQSVYTVLKILCVLPADPSPSAPRTSVSISGAPFFFFLRSFQTLLRLILINCSSICEELVVAAS